MALREWRDRLRLRRMRPWIRRDSPVDREGLATNSPHARQGGAGRGIAPRWRLGGNMALTVTAVSGQWAWLPAGGLGRGLGRAGPAGQL